MPSSRKLPYRSIWVRTDAAAGWRDALDFVGFGYPRSERDERTADPDNELYFLQGLPRSLFRHTPAVAAGYLAVEVLLFLSAGGTASLDRALFQLLPAGLGPTRFVILLLSTMVGSFLGANAVKIRSGDGQRARRLLQSLALLAFLALVGLFAYVRFGAESGGSEPVNAEYALLIMLGGSLVYDGMLRTESLFWHLGDPEHRRVWEPSAYSRFRWNVTTDLDWYRDPPWNVLLLGGIALWVLAAVSGDVLAFLSGGPSVLPTALRVVDHALLVVTRAMIILLAINFLVLVRYVSRLSSSTTATPTLRYHPFHPDQLGGFRDVGKFATRVNVLLLLGGVYVVYRIFVFDLTGLADPYAPLVAYAVVTVGWFYLTFWKLHVRMVEEINAWLAAGRNPSMSRSWGRALDQSNWRALATAPRWPISNRRLTELVSANLLTFVFGVFQFLVRVGALGGLVRV